MDLDDIHMYLHLQLRIHIQDFTPTEPTLRPWQHRRDRVQRYHHTSFKPEVGSQSTSA